MLLSAPRVTLRAVDTVVAVRGSRRRSPGLLAVAAYARGTGIHCCPVSAQVPTLLLLRPLRVTVDKRHDGVTSRDARSAALSSRRRGSRARFAMLRRRRPRSVMDGTGGLDLHATRGAERRHLERAEAS